MDDIPALIPPWAGDVASTEERAGVLWITTTTGDIFSAHRVGPEGFELRLEQRGPEVAQ